MANNKNFILNPYVWLILALTLGLMPYAPEPHIWEKLKWIFAGAEGMKLLDWFDFLLHGAPWILFIISFVKKIIDS